MDGHGKLCCVYVPGVEDPVKDLVHVPHDGLRLDPLLRERTPAVHHDHLNLKQDTLRFFLLLTIQDQPEGTFLNAGFNPNTGVFIINPGF